MFYELTRKNALPNKYSMQMRTSADHFIDATLVKTLVAHLIVPVTMDTIPQRKHGLVMVNYTFFKLITHNMA